MKTERIQRGVILARDAGAEAVVVLTKAATVADPDGAADRVRN